MRFITNSFSAEYGRSAGGVVVAAGRSGSNQLHGSAYDYLRNDKLNANSWANNRNNVARGRQRRNDYGFSVSGPVLLPKHLRRAQQDLLLLQLGADQRPRRQHAYGQRADSVQQMSGDFSQTMTSAGALIRIYDPLTTVADASQASGYGRQPFPGNVIPAKPHRSDHEEGARLLPGADAGRFAHAATSTGRRTSRSIVKTSRWFTRGDHNFGDRNKFFFRYGYERTPRTSPYTNIAFPGEGTNGGGNQERVAYTAALSDTHTFSPNLIGEFRAGYTRGVTTLTPLSVGFDITTLGLPQYMKAASGDAIFPRFNITDFTSIGPDRASHNVDAETTPEFQAHFTWLKGSHAVKTGYDLPASARSIRSARITRRDSSASAGLSRRDPILARRVPPPAMAWPAPCSARRIAASSPSARRWRSCSPATTGTCRTTGRSGAT